MFFMFGIISFVGSLYCYTFIKETKDLSDKQKKVVFVPIIKKLHEKIMRDSMIKENDDDEWLITEVG